VTSLMIAFLAAGMAAQSVFFLERAGVIEFLGETAWDSSALLSETSIIGRILHTLIGYSDQPSIMQLLTYVATLAILYLLTRTFSSPGRPQAVRANT
jgi:high-affinity iron transporter